MEGVTLFLPKAAPQCRSQFMKYRIASLLTFVVAVYFHGPAQAVLLPNSPARIGICKKLLTDFSRSRRWPVQDIVSPATVEELQQAVRQTSLPVSVRGGGFSMGGQTAAEGGLVIDMSRLNQVISYDPQGRLLTVQAGATWRQIQELIDRDQLSVKVMQSYNNFQVGGSLSVNVHGRYVGYGPIISTVREIAVLLADGSVVRASRSQNPDLFFGAIGGYGALGVIVEATLELADNKKLERTVREFQSTDIAAAVESYLAHFAAEIEPSGAAVMTNADIYPPRYQTIRSITFSETEKPLTVEQPLQPAWTDGGFAGLMRAVLVSAEQLTQKLKVWRETHHASADLAQSRVVWRNFEASYDVRGLRSAADQFPWLRRVLPMSNRQPLLQEYFVPREKLPKFIATLRDILLRFKVNVSNISLRHVAENKESLMSWSSKDCFAVVMYYTQSYGWNQDRHIANATEWTREVIDAVIAAGGTYYLPYQTYATQEQFMAAYPGYAQFFAVKEKYDPEHKFINNLWAQYESSVPTFHYRTIMADPKARKELESFFIYVFNIFDPQRFLAAIDLAIKRAQEAGRELNDRNVYEELAKVLPQFAPGFWQRTTNSISSLRQQQLEMANQTVQALKTVGIAPINGYVEIGTPGRYIPYLKSRLPLWGPVYVVDDDKPGFNPSDVLERTGGYGALDPRSYLPAFRRAKYVPLSDYDMITQADVPNESVDLVSMFIGLHHAPPEKLRPFVASIFRMLRPGGKFVLRDHDAGERILPIAFLAHSTYNAGLGVPFRAELDEIRNLQPVSYWQQILSESGFIDRGVQLLQNGDPTGNTLLVFEKPLHAQPVVNAIAGLQSDNTGGGDPFASLTSLPGYHRSGSQTIMTQPEWFLVDIFTEFAAFMRHTPWYEFPFQDFIQLYEQVYQTHRRYALAQGILDVKAFEEYDAMDKSLLTGIKGLFTLMGWAAKMVKGQQTGQVVDPNTQFLASIPDEAIAQLPEGMAQLLREFGGGVHLVQTPRYMPFTEVMRALAEHPQAQVLDVAGNKHMSVIFSAPMAQLPPFAGLDVEPIMTYQYPTVDPSLAVQPHFHSVRVGVRDLGGFLRALNGLGFQLVRIHDF